MHKLSIVLPVYNEEIAVKNTLNNLKIYTNSSDFEILVINDGSTDNSKSIIEKIEGIRIISHPYNKGYGAALKTGIRAAKTDYIAFFDSDGQHNPNNLINLWNKIGNYDMLVGERGKDSHSDWVRKPGKWVLAKVANFLTGKKIPDLNSGLRVIKRNSILDIIHLLPDGFSLSTTSTVAFMNMGYNVGYSPIKVNKRVGKSTVKQLKHGSSTLLLILRLIILFNPLKVFLPVSFSLGLAGLIYEIAYGFVLSTHIRVLPGAILMILSSIIIFLFGLVADQVSETRKHLFMK